MAKDYPRYERQARRGSAQLRSPGQIDFAASRESARNAQIVGNAADQMFNFAMRGVEKQAVHQGKRDALIDTSGTLKRYQSTAPQTKYEESAYATAVDISATRISTQARKGMNDAWLEWNQNWQEQELTPDDLRNSLAAISTGYSDTITALDPLAGEKLRGKLEMHSQSLYLDVSGTYLKQEAKEMAAAQIDLLDLTEDQLRKFASQGNLTSSQFDSTLSVFVDEYKRDQKNLGRDPNKIAGDIAKLKSQSHEDRVRGQYSILTSLEDQAEYLKKFKADSYGENTGTKLARGLDSGQIKMLTGEMERGPKAAAAKLRRQASSVSSAASELFRNLGDAHVPAASEVESLEKLAEQTGDPDAIASVTLLSEGIKLQARMMKMSAAEQSNVVDAMRGATADKGTGDRQADLIDLATKISKHTQVSMSKDQVTYYNRWASPGDQLPPIRFEDLNISNEEGIAKLRDRITRINKFAVSMGSFDPIYFSKTEADQISSVFNGLMTETAPHLKLAAVKALNLASAGAGRPISLVQQISGNAGSLVVAGSISAGGNDQGAIDIFDGLAAVKAGGAITAVEAGGEFTNLKKEEVIGKLLATGESGSYLLEGRSLGTVRTAAGALFQGMLRRSDDARSDPAEWYKRAFQQALGADYVGEDIVTGGVHEGARKTDTFLGWGTSHKIHLDTNMPVADFRALEENLVNLKPEHINGLNQGWPKVGNKNKEDAKIGDLQQAVFAPSASGRAGWVRLLTPQGDEYLDGYEVNLKKLYGLMTTSTPVVEPKAVEPKAVKPKAVEPKAVEPTYTGENKPGPSVDEDTLNFSSMDEAEIIWPDTEMLVPADPFNTEMLVPGAPVMHTPTVVLPRTKAADDPEMLVPKPGEAFRQRLRKLDKALKKKGKLNETALMNEAVRNYSSLVRTGKPVISGANEDALRDLALLRAAQHVPTVDEAGLEVQSKKYKDYVALQQQILIKWGGSLIFLNALGIRLRLANLADRRKK